MTSSPAFTQPTLTARSRSGRAAAYLAAAALSVVGGLASSPLTQAAPPMPLSPPCSQWQYKGNMPITQTNGVRIDVPWGGTQVGGIANEFQGNEKRNVGSADGGVNGNNIDFTVNWTGNGGPGHYTASINNDGDVVLGVTTDSRNNRADWHTDARFTCAVAAAAPPAAPPPAAPAPPPVDTHAQAKVTNAITLTFGPPGFGKVTATVANSSDLTGKCHYHADPSNTNRDFTVNPHNSTDLTFTGFNTGTTYHATVTCTDASGKQQEPIGTSSSSVTF